MIEFDTREVRQLVDDLDTADTETTKEVRAVVQRGAFNIKKDWQNRWKGLGNLPHVAAAVTYDTKVTGEGISAEIGADRGRIQGNLAHIPEFGTPTSAAHPGGGPALKTEEPKFLKALADVLTKAVE